MDAVNKSLALYFCVRLCQVFLCKLSAAKIYYGAFSALKPLPTFIYMLPSFNLHEKIVIVRPRVFC